MKFYHIGRFIGLRTFPRRYFKAVPYSLDQKILLDDPKTFFIDERSELGEKLSKTISPIYSKSKLSCQGCGANFQTINPSHPGYLDEFDLGVYNTIQSNAKKSATNIINCDQVCSHCETYSSQKGLITEACQSYLARDHVLNINAFNPVIIYCVDMTNFPHCISSQALELMPKGQFILCLTKCDLVPIDKKESLRRWKFIVQKKFLEECRKVDPDFSEERILISFFVSSKTGHGIDALNDFLLSNKYSMAQTSFPIMGCVNSGKSSLFNRLLMSDVCSPGIRHSIQRSKVSTMPGTTAGPVWFPRNRMNSTQRYFRSQVLKEEKQFKAATPKDSEHGFKKFSPKNVIISSVHDSEVESYQNKGPMIESISLKPGENDQVSDKMVMEKEIFHEQDLEDPSVSKEILEPRHLLKEVSLLRKFNKANGFFDLPPCPSERYLLGNELGKNEYTSLFKSLGTHRQDLKPSFIRPRIFSLREGMTMSVACFALLSIDKLVNCDSIFLNTQTPLPIHIFPSEEADKYLQAYSNLLLPEQVEVSTPKRRIFCEKMLENLGNANNFTLKDASLFTTQPTLRVNFEIVLSDLGWLGIAPGIPVEPFQVDKDLKKSVTLSFYLLRGPLQSIC